jgi:hypothetical protein
MRYRLAALLCTASICAFACAIPAVAWAMGGGDANAEADQAQLHPWSPDQAPNWIPNGVPMGEVYAGVPAYAYVPPAVAYVSPPAVVYVSPLAVAPVIVPITP